MEHTLKSPILCGSWIEPRKLADEDLVIRCLIENQIYISLFGENSFRSGSKKNTS